MPTYRYECTACGARLEEFQGINDERLEECPTCGERRLRRLVGPGGGFIFKGPGFFATDYRGR